MLELKISTAPSPYFLFIYLFFDKVRVIFVIKYGSFWCATVLLVNTKSDQHGLPIQKIGEAIALTMIAATEKHFTLSLNGSLNLPRSCCCCCC